MVEFVGRFRGEVRRSASAAYALVDFGMTLKIVEQRCRHYLALRQYFDSGGYVLPYLGKEDRVVGTAEYESVYVGIFAEQGVDVLF